MSRAYTGVNKSYTNTLWFNRFVPQPNADLFILTGTYTQFPQNTNKPTSNPDWQNMMLAFTFGEMTTFMEEVRLKKDSSKYDKMFGFGFNSPDKIYQTRGYSEIRDMSYFLLENRIKDIEDLFS